MQDIKKRLAILEAQNLIDAAFCLVELLDGSEKEVDVEEWYEHRDEWRFLRMTKGSDNMCLHLLFAAWAEASGAMDQARAEETAYFHAAQR